MENVKTLPLYDSLVPVSEYITSRYSQGNHASAHVLAEALAACGLALVRGEEPVEECGLCGRERGESHREDCEAREVDGEYVG